MQNRIISSKISVSIEKSAFVVCDKMNGVNGNGNGVALAKNGHVYLTKKQGAPRSDDPEYLAECRYAKENGLEIPIAPEPVKPVEHSPRALTQRNRKS